MEEVVEVGGREEEVVVAEEREEVVEERAEEEVEAGVSNFSEGLIGLPWYPTEYKLVL